MSFEQAFLKVLHKTAADRTCDKRRTRYAGEQLDQLIEREGSEYAILVCARICDETEKRAVIWNVSLGFLAGVAFAVLFGPLSLGHLVGAAISFFLLGAVGMLWRRRPL